jgi:hypothetical protein
MMVVIAIATRSSMMVNPEGEFLDGFFMMMVTPG